MLIEVHYGNQSVLLVNGNCRAIHILDFIRKRCCLSSSTNFDICLINSGEPFNLSSTNTKFISSERQRFSSHLRCVLTRIDGSIHFELHEGTYIPLLNDPKLITNEFLMKLKRATSKKGPSKQNVPMDNLKANAPSNKSARRRSFKSVAIATTFISTCNR